MLLLELVVVLVDFRPELDFLDLDDLLVLLRFARALLLLALVLAEIHDAADRRNGGRRDLDQVESLLSCAMASACGGGMIPSCCPVSSITRISRTRIRSLTRTRSSRRGPLSISDKASYSQWPFDCDLGFAPIR